MRRFNSRGYGYRRKTSKRWTEEITNEILEESPVKATPPPHSLPPPKPGLQRAAGCSTMPNVGGHWPCFPDLLPRDTALQRSSPASDKKVSSQQRDHSPHCMLSAKKRQACYFLQELGLGQNLRTRRQTSPEHRAQRRGGLWCELEAGPAEETAVRGASLSSLERETQLGSVWLFTQELLPLSLGLSPSLQRLILSLQVSCWSPRARGPTVRPDPRLFKRNSSPTTWGSWGRICVWDERSRIFIPSLLTLKENPRPPEMEVVQQSVVYLHHILQLFKIIDPEECLRAWGNGHRIISNGKHRINITYTIQVQFEKKKE